MAMTCHTNVGRRQGRVGSPRGEAPPLPGRERGASGKAMGNPSGLTIAPLPTGRKRVEGRIKRWFQTVSDQRPIKRARACKPKGRRIGYRSSLVLKRCRSPMAACMLPRASRSLYGPPRPPSPTPAPTPKRQGKSARAGRLHHTLARPPTRGMQVPRSSLARVATEAKPGALA